MRNEHEKLGVAFAVVAGLVGAAGCERKPTPPPVPSATSAAPVERGDEDPPAGPRQQKIDLTLTDARRARIEAKIPEAQGFIAAPDLERELQRNPDVDREEAAMEHLDALAKGKWILFMGPMLERDADGYVMTLTYHPGSKRDKMRVTPSWLRVELTNIRGYSTILTQDGMETAVVAKYLGKGRAAPAHDLVGRSIW